MFTIANAVRLMLFTVAALSHSVAAADTTTRTATLTESGAQTVHHYSDNGNTSKQTSPTTHRTIRHLSPFLWLYDVTINLHQDYDSDGYYSNFSITFDFGTQTSPTDVYAVLYVSNHNGGWIEYAVTGNFTIGAATNTHTIYATLDTGYQTGYYDHYIEIYDAYTHDYLTGFGPEDSHVLHGLPIESTSYDYYHSGISTSVSLRFSGAGSLDIISSLLLTLFAVTAANRRRRAQ